MQQMSIRSAPGSTFAFGLVVTGLLLLTTLQSPFEATHAVQAIPSPSGALPSSVRHASMGVAADPLGVQPAPSPSYDQQIGTTFTQNFSSLAFNVTAVAQADANGYGPGYLLNGLTAQGFWYQVGVSYHWPLSDGTYLPGFGFSYEVFGPAGKSVYPLGGGAGLENFSGSIRSGDSVLLSLTFSGSSVQMRASDWNTGAIARESFSSNGSTQFVGQTYGPGNVHGFFTGLMTEWYHSAAYSSNQQEVSYTEYSVPLTSAWLWIDEFNSATPNSPLFVKQTPGPVALYEGRLYPFAASGLTSYMSANEFITGMLSSTSSSRITLAPALSGESGANFSLAYTLAGQALTSTIGSGVTLIVADSGSTITVSTNDSGRSGYRWVFNGTSGTQVSFVAGTNGTYAYYGLVEQTVSYQVAGGGPPPPSAPTLTYQVPPPAIASTSSQVTETLVIGTQPVVIFAIPGTVASLDGAVGGSAGERWAPDVQSWVLSYPDSLPQPILYYHQYEVAVNYSVAGGGSPAETPTFDSTSFGSPEQLQIPGTGVILRGWYDAGSRYSFSAVLNGSTPGERWFNSENGSVLTVTSPRLEASAMYHNQYEVEFAVNAASGGTVYFAVPGGSASVHIKQGPVWFDAYSTLNATASAAEGWRFESWAGSGPGAYSGGGLSFQTPVTGPLSENATFYVRLDVVAGPGADVAFTYPSGSGTVKAGTTQTLYVAPSSGVTLDASPASFIYSFSSWQGTGVSNATRPSLALVVASPTEITAASSYDYPVVLGLACAAVVVLLAAALLIRRRSRRGRGLTPVYPTPSAGPQT